jgi:PAS domain S-box-containing protein
MNPRNPVILCVDNEEANIRLLEDILVPRGYTVVGAASGKDALLKIKSQAIDLVLLDVVMPGMDGFEVCRQIKEDQKLRNIPVIIVTALTARQDHVRGIEAGADEFLSKPIEKIFVLARIKALLKVKALSDERLRAEDALQKANQELESRVQERTAKLSQANEMLQADIAERIRIELQKRTALEALRKSEDNFHRSLNESPLGVRIVTADGDTIYANRAIVDIYGYDSIEELRGAPLKDLYTPESYAEFKIRKGKRERGEFCPSEYEISIVRKNGEVRRVQALRKEVFWNGARQFQVIYQDITDRKRAEETLKESEKKYRLLADNIHDVIFVMDMNLVYSYLSPSVKFLRGYEPEEAMKQTPAETVTPSSLNLALGILSEIMELEKSEHRDLHVSRTFQAEMIRKDGTTVWTEVRASLIRDENQQAIGIMGVTRDISERKRAEDALRDSEEQYRMVVDNAKEAIFILQDDKIVFVNPAVLGMVGYSEDILTSKPFTDFVHPDDLDMVVNHHIRRIKGEEVPPVYSFRVIGKDGTVIWCELNGAVIQWKNKPATLAFLTNITERKRADDELQRTLDNLKKAFAANVAVMVSAVEMRDPYTAGHQSRVADLTCAIAMEMGLPPDKIEGSRMAGSIHDIGKLSIPAEILSKPAKLTDIELTLIKEHSQRGYEILKNVESPWPLAQIVYQHHERMDGSGYPRNLKGDEILMEARILAVADVVEAMASHRPYRPALGIETALKEIEKKKGFIYDDTVVDACLRVFREKGYQLRYDE